MHTKKEMIKTLKLIAHQVNGAIALLEAGCIKPNEHYEAREFSDRIEVGDFIITDRSHKTPEFHVPGRPTVSQLVLDDPLGPRR